MKTAKITSQKTILGNTFFSVIENTIVYDNGLKRVHADIYRRPAVSIFPITDEYEIYLIKQYRYLHEKVLIEGIAGIMDEGEEPIGAAKRELAEETGMIADDFRVLQTIQIAGSFIKAEQHLILAKDLTQGVAHPEETESIELIKMPLAEAVGHVLHGEIETASSAIGILLIDELRRKGKL